MPIKLVPPRAGASQNWRIRGTYLRVYVDRSTGTSDRRLAARILAKTRKDIEAGLVSSSTGPTFASAALAYMKAGGEKRYLEPLLAHFKETALEDINQASVDAAAVILYPTVSNATRNRQVYTPVAAVLRYADPERALRLRRPKGADGQKRVRWLEPEDAWRLIENAGELRPLVVFLIYTGCRLGEALSLDWDLVNLGQRFAYVAETKNDDPRGVHLPVEIITELMGIEPKTGLVFGGIAQRNRFYKLWHAVCAKAGIADFTPHDCRHTWATWMRRYAGLDTKGLVGTGAWRDERSASRYVHVVASEEAKAADLLPTPKRAKLV